MMEHIRELMNNLCIPKGMCDGIGVCFGTKKKSVSECLDERNSNSIFDSDTIFDLASVTKLFLAIVYLKLVEERQVCLDKTIRDYTDRFPNICDIKLCHILSFNVELHTDKRIDKCVDRSEAVSVLNEIKGSYIDKPVYSDMPSMILGELLTDISGKDFGTWIDELFIIPLGLKNTVWKDVYRYKNKVCSYENEKWYVDGMLYEKNNPVAIVNDPKSRILGDQSKLLCGNAGLFSSINDLKTISQALLCERIISKKSLKEIAEGSGWSVRGEKQSFGFQCYRKDLDPIQTEVPLQASQYAIASVGFTGIYWMLDIEKECYIIIAGNKLRNCVSKVSPRSERFGNRILIDGKEYLCSINYVFQRDELRDYIYSCLL